MNIEEYFHDKNVAKLAEAAGEGDTRTMDRLIQSGVDVNTTGKDDMTPLLWILFKQNLEGFEALLHQGADPNYKTKTGHSVVSLCSGARDSSFLEISLRYGGNPNITTSTDNALMIAASNNRIPQIRMLLDAGANIDYQGYLGYTALTTAIVKNHVEAVQLLLDRGATATSISGDSITALEAAAIHKNSKIIEIIKNAIGK